MTDFFTELNRLMDWLALQPDVSATALAGDASTYLVLSDQHDKYVAHDGWAVGFDAVGDPECRGLLTARECRFAGANVTLLFGDTSWAIAPVTAADRDIAENLFEIYDPRGLIQNLIAKSGKHRIGFASNDEIAKYGDVSSDFFRLIGLAEDVVFISDTSTLKDWCDIASISLDHAIARIYEIYGVDVSDLDGGRLIDVFERIRQGEYYRTWRAKHGA